MNLILLIVFLCLLVGFFVLAGLIGEVKKLDQQEEFNRIRQSIHRDAARNIGLNWRFEGDRK